MSFSTEVKTELSKLNTLANKENVKAELLGYLSTSNANLVDNKIRFATESEYNINRFSKVLQNLKINKYQIDIQGKTYSILLKKDVYFPEIKYEGRKIEIVIDIQKATDEFKKAFLRGTFLGSGSVNNPKKQYHLDIICSRKEAAQLILVLMNEYDLHFKIVKRKEGYAVYTKEGETISDFLALIGANHSVLQFEEIRVLRDMSNQVNRMVNCETANLNKTITASVKQVSDIQYLTKQNKLKDLSSALREIAEVRVQNPEATLTELGQMLKTPIGKSGVNHRLKAIEKIVGEMKKQK